MRPENFFPLNLLFLSHIIADYVCQPKDFTRRKRKKKAYLFLHVAIVWAVGFLLLLPYWNGKTLLAVSILSISHLIIDWNKIMLERKIKRILKEKGLLKTVNVVDQGLHFLAIVCVWRVFLTGFPWPFGFLPSPVFLNSVAILVIILITARGGIGLLNPEEED